MKKVGVIISIIIIYFAIYFLQVNFFSWFNIAGIQPNLFIVLALFLGLYIGGKYGSIISFFIGLYTDFLFSNSIGITAVIFAIVAYSGDYLEKRFSRDSKITMVFMGAIVTAIYEIITIIFNFFRFSVNFNIIAFIKILCLEIIFNAFLIIILYPLIHKLGMKAESIFKNNKMLTKYF